MNSESSRKDNIKLPAGEYLYRQEEPAEHFYVLRKGELELQRNNRTLRKLNERNDPLGSAELILEIDRTTDAVVTADVLVQQITLNGSQLLEWLIEHPLSHVKCLKNTSTILDRLNQESKQRFETFRGFRPAIKPLLDLNKRIQEEIDDPESEAPRLLQAELRERVESNPLRELSERMDEIILFSGKTPDYSLPSMQLPDNRVESLPPGEDICREGEEGERLFVLLEGVLSVHKEGQRIATIEVPGSVFGEMAALLDGRRTATVRTDTQSSIASLPVQSLPDLFDRSPTIARKLDTMFSKRLQHTAELTKNLRTFNQEAAKLKRSHNQFRSVQEYVDDLLDLLDGTPVAETLRKRHASLFDQWLEGEDPFGKMDVAGPSDRTDFLMDSRFA